MTEQIIEILKISSLVIFNLFFAISAIVALVFLRLALKLNKVRKTATDDLNEITATFKSKIANIDEDSVGVISGLTAGIMHGVTKPKKKKSSFDIAKKIFAFISK